MTSSCESNLEVVDVFAVVDPARVLHQNVQLAASRSRHVDRQDFVPLQDPHSRLEEAREEHRQSSER